MSRGLDNEGSSSGLPQRAVLNVCRPIPRLGVHERFCGIRLVDLFGSRREFELLTEKIYEKTSL